MTDLKTCSRCRVTLPTCDFPMTTARGKLHFRSWRPACLAAYYRERTARLKEERKVAGCG